jgi:hypothetical protein
MSGTAAASILRGIARLVRFRADGFANFTATPTGFLNSLAPMLAFPLVDGVILLLVGASRTALASVLSNLVLLLAPAVLSHLLAQFWRREAQWLRYVVAYNWCLAAMTLVVVVLVVGMLTAANSNAAAVELLALTVMGLAIYWLALSWFMVWRGLNLSWWRAVLFVVLLNLGTGVLVLGPRMAAGTMSGTLY